MNSGTSFIIPSLQILDIQNPGNWWTAGIAFLQNYLLKKIRIFVLDIPGLCLDTKVCPWYKFRWRIFTPNCWPEAGISVDRATINFPGIKK